MTTIVTVCDTLGYINQIAWVDNHGWAVVDRIPHVQYELRGGRADLGQIVGSTWVFASPKHALLFKLTWGGGVICHT